MNYIDHFNKILETPEQKIQFQFKIHSYQKNKAMT